MAAYTAIDDSEAYFQPVIYTGTGSSQAVTLPGSTDMQPDVVWINGRDQANMDQWYDSQSGVLKFISPNIASGEETLSGTGTAAGMSAFGSDGFTVLTHNGINKSSQLYVALCWKAGGSGSANTAGSINTTATSVDTTHGFSIMQYEGNVTAGATIGHGIGAAPHFMIFKNIDASRSWYIYHHKNTAAPATDYLKLDTNAATADFDGLWNDTAPSSTLVTLGDGSDTNGDGETHIAYCWTEVQGFSKFGTYTGNGNADGPFVYTGFKPAFVILKRTASSNSWQLGDNKRTPNNPANIFLFPDTSGAEESFTLYDSLSNGFKIRSSTSAINTSGEAFIYMAFAEAPFVNSEGVPNNAE